MNRRNFLLTSALTLSACIARTTLSDGNPGKIYLPLVMTDQGSDVTSLPRNLITNPGKIYEDFTDVKDWKVVNGSLSVNTEQFKTGNQSLRLINDLEKTASMVKTVNWNLSGDWGRLLLWFYVEHASVTDFGDSFVLSLSNDPNFTRYFQCNLYNMYNTMNGWTTITWAKGEMTAKNSPSWSEPIVGVRLECVGGSGRVVDVSFDSLYFGIHSIPAAMFSFDDGSNQQYDNAFLYMKQLGIRGNLWAETDLVGLDSGYLTWSKVKEMADAGWIVGNHTNSSRDLSTKTLSDQVSQIKGGMDSLLLNGLNTGAHYVAYPGGGFNENTMTAMNNLSMLTGRATKPTTQQGEPMLALPFSPMYILPSNGVTSSMPVAVWKSLIDKAISGGYIMPFHWHKVGDTNQMTSDDFKSCMDYFKSKKDAGLIYDLTIDDLYQLTLNAIQVPG